MRLVRMRLRLRDARYMAKYSVWGRGKARDAGQRRVVYCISIKDVNVVPSASLSNLRRLNAHTVMIVALVCVAI